MVAIKADISKKAAVAFVKLPAKATVTKQSKVLANPASQVMTSAGAAMAWVAASPAITHAWGTTSYIPEGTVPKVTPSLKAFLYSCLWGGIVLGAILGAVIFVSNFDPIRKIEETE